MRILGIAGSLRQGSYNKALLRAAIEVAPSGVHIDVFDLAGIPGFNEDEEREPPQKVVEFKQRIREADGILIATPEYNYSIPGVLKNAIDWASRPYGDSAWNGKRVAIMGASVGMLGTARAQYHLRQSFVFLNMHAMNQPEVMVPFAASKVDDNGRITDQQTLDIVTRFMAAFVTWCRTGVEAA